MILKIDSLMVQKKQNTLWPIAFWQMITTLTLPPWRHLQDGKYFSSTFRRARDIWYNDVLALRHLILRHFCFQTGCVYRFWKRILEVEIFPKTFYRNFDKFREISNGIVHLWIRFLLYIKVEVVLFRPALRYAGQLLRRTSLM